MDLNTEFEKSDSDGDEGMEEGEFYTYDFDKKIWRFPGPAGRFPTRDSRVKVADLGFDEFKATQAWKEILSVDVGNAKRVHIRTVILNTAKVRIWKEGYIVARIKIMNHDPKRPTLVLEDETGTHLAMMSEDVSIFKSNYYKPLDEILTKFSYVSIRSSLRRNGSYGKQVQQ